MHGNDVLGFIPSSKTTQIVAESLFRYFERVELAHKYHQMNCLSSEEQ